MIRNEESSKFSSQPSEMLRAVVAATVGDDGSRQTYNHLLNRLTPCPYSPGSMNGTATTSTAIHTQCKKKAKPSGGVVADCSWYGILKTESKTSSSEHGK